MTTFEQRDNLRGEEQLVKNPLKLEDARKLDWALREDVMRLVNEIDDPQKQEELREILSTFSPQVQGALDHAVAEVESYSDYKTKNNKQKTTVDLLQWKVSLKDLELEYIWADLSKKEIKELIKDNFNIIQILGDLQSFIEWVDLWLTKREDKEKANSYTIFKNILSLPSKKWAERIFAWNRSLFELFNNAFDGKDEWVTQEQCKALIQEYVGVDQLKTVSKKVVTTEWTPAYNEWDTFYFVEREVDGEDDESKVTESWVIQFWENRELLRRQLNHSDEVWDQELWENFSTNPTTREDFWWSGWFAEFLAHDDDFVLNVWDYQAFVTKLASSESNEVVSDYIAALSAQIQNYYTWDDISKRDPILVTQYVQWIGDNFDGLADHLDARSWNRTEDVLRKTSPEAIRMLWLPVWESAVLLDTWKPLYDSMVAISWDLKTEVKERQSEQMAEYYKDVFESNDVSAINMAFDRLRSRFWPGFDEFLGRFLGQEFVDWFKERLSLTDEERQALALLTATIDAGQTFWSNAWPIQQLNNLVDGVTETSDVKGFDADEFLKHVTSTDNAKTYLNQVDPQLAARILATWDNAKTYKKHIKTTNRMFGTKVLEGDLYTILTEDWGSIDDFWKTLLTDRALHIELAELKKKSAEVAKDEWIVWPSMTSKTMATSILSYSFNPLSLDGLEMWYWTADHAYGTETIVPTPPTNSEVTQDAPDKWYKQVENVDIDGDGNLDSWKYIVETSADGVLVVKKFNEETKEWEVVEWVDTSKIARIHDLYTSDQLLSTAWLYTAAASEYQKEMSKDDAVEKDATFVAAIEGKILEQLQASENKDTQSYVVDGKIQLITKPKESTDPIEYEFAVQKEGGADKLIPLGYEPEAAQEVDKPAEDASEEDNVAPEGVERYWLPISEAILREDYAKLGDMKPVIKQLYLKELWLYTKKLDGDFWSGSKSAEKQLTDDTDTLTLSYNKNAVPLVPANLKVYSWFAKEKNWPTEETAAKFGSYLTSKIDTIEQPVIKNALVSVIAEGKNQWVRSMQSLLQKAWYLTGSVDNTYGNDTDKWLTAFINASNQKFEQISIPDDFIEPVEETPPVAATDPSTIDGWTPVETAPVLDPLDQLAANPSQFTSKELFETNEALHDKVIAKYQEQLDNKKNGRTFDQDYLTAINDMIGERILKSDWLKNQSTYWLFFVERDGKNILNSSVDAEIKIESGMFQLCNNATCLEPLKFGTIEAADPETIIIEGWWWTVERYSENIPDHTEWFLELANWMSQETFVSEYLQPDSWKVLLEFMKDKDCEPCKRAKQKMMDLAKKEEYSDVRFVAIPQDLWNSLFELAWSRPQELRELQNFWWMYPSLQLFSQWKYQKSMNSGIDDEDFTAILGERNDWLANV